VKEESNRKPTPKLKQQRATSPQKRKAMTKPLKGDLPSLEQLKVDFNDFEKISQNLTPPEVTDYLPNVKEKEKTALNTREFVFFSFYERMKKRLGMFWTPALERKFQKMYYANVEVDDRDLVTKLIIVLDNEGNIKRIEKLESSGFVDLDNAAVEAFTRAAPFSNPPKGILDDDETVVIKWDFILKTSNESIGFVLSQL
jgi:TonB family protein